MGTSSQGQARRIAEVLERDGLLVVWTGSDVAEISLELTSSRLDAVVVDGTTNEADTERTLRRLRDGPRPPAIVVICAGNDAWQLARYLEAGADGLVFAHDLVAALASVVSAACAGQLSVPRNMRHLLAPPALSYREKQVVALAARGLTNRQIADRLFLAESTVKTHLSSAFRRLGVSSRREAAALISAGQTPTRRGQVPPSPTPGTSRVMAVGGGNWEPASRGA